MTKEIAAKIITENMTYAELEAYSNRRGKTHIWDKSLYPATPTELLSRK